MGLCELLSLKIRSQRVSSIKRKSGRTKLWLHPLVMILVRDLVLTSLKHNILFHARYIPGVHNTGADYISRFQIEQFKQISPGADDLPTLVPAHLLPQSWSLR